jgi:hypothetical protein
MTEGNQSRNPIVPDRVRKTGGQSFAFIPHRFLREGFFSSLSPMELRLYVFLVLAGDRNGVSYYHFERISSILEVCVEDYIEARDKLLSKDLIAYDGSRYQVLSLPERPVYEASRNLRTSQDLETHDPATVRMLARQSFAEASSPSPNRK